MSEAINPPVLSQGEGAYGSPSASEVLRLVERLAALLPSLLPGTLDLDELMTPEQCAKWLQLDVKTLNQKARRKIVPAMMLSKNTYRYHPRTILAELHKITPELLRARTVKRRGPRTKPFSILP